MDVFGCDDSCSVRWHLLDTNPRFLTKDVAGLLGSLGHVPDGSWSDGGTVAVAGPMAFSVIPVARVTAVRQSLLLKSALPVGAVWQTSVHMTRSPAVAGDREGKGRA